MPFAFHGTHVHQRCFWSMYINSIHTTSLKAELHALSFLKSAKHRQKLSGQENPANKTIKDLTCFIWRSVLGDTMHCLYMYYRQSLFMDFFIHLWCSWKCLPVSPSGSKRLRHYPWQHAESHSFDSLLVDENHWYEFRNSSGICCAWSG